MDVLKTLKDIRYINMEIEYTNKKIEELRNRKASIKSTSDIGTQSGSHVSNPNKNPMDLICSIADLEQTLEEKLIKLYRLKKDTEDQLDVLEPKARMIIKLHYFEGVPIEGICGIINYSYRHTKRMFNEAVNTLKQIS